MFGALKPRTLLARCGAVGTPSAHVSVLVCPWYAVSQIRGPSGSNPINSVSLLQQYYKSMPIRKKWRKAIQKGTMIWCNKTGQVRIPPMTIQGYDAKNPYRGKWTDLRAPRVYLKD
uniref:Uncharacterized protein n=1 Tax=Noctiluca scintillans TaxID=2966 RepID=A0A7S1F7C3_NOCSC|mmetsp:Transcript_40364/g.107057  ORF Transcript_40364/g.107057 Transcript_40364/m.107057 type:complete len:116 (+) Transcript_40364:81-428(+)